MFGTVKAGATSVSLDVLLLKTADNTAETGLTKSSMTIKYYRSTPTGGAITDITSSLSDLSALSSSFTAFGVKEINYGSYRFDAPDAMWAAGADWVELSVVTTNSLYKERFAIEAYGTEDIVGAFPTNFSTMAIDSSGRVDVGKILGTASAGTAGYVGIDWGHVNAPTTTVGLSGTTVGTTTVVGSVTSGVTVTTNNDKTGYKLAADGLTAASTTVPAVTVTTNNDKTGYKLAADGLTAAPTTIPSVTVSDKTGYALASTGLDAIPITDPGGVSGQTTFPKILVALYRRFFKKSTMTASELKTYGDNGTTVNTTQALSDDTTTQTQDAAV